MRPMRYREHRGCARPLSTRNTHLLHQIPFRDDPIFLCTGGCTAPSTGLPPAFSSLGTGNRYFLCVDGRGCQFYLSTPDDKRTTAKCRHCVPIPRCSIACRYGFQPSKNYSLQSRSLPSPALELGAHLYMQALWTVPLDSFLAQRPGWFIWPNRQNG